MEEKKKKTAEKKEKTSIEELESKIKELEKKLEEQTEITKKAQYDYINLKMDRDRRSRLKEEEAKTANIDSIVNVVSKFLPFIEGLRKSLETIPQNQKSNPLAQGVQMVYDKFLQTLESMKIKSISSIGQNPDSNLHEPVSTQAIDDEKMKGKIISEFERGFVYDDGQTKKIISTSKVVIGQ